MTDIPCMQQPRALSPVGLENYANGAWMRISTIQEYKNHAELANPIPHCRTQWLPSL
jgi:hypothetical protein